jgi:hypothetical protein
MTTLDTIAHLAQHARNHHLGQRIKMLSATSVQTILALPDGELGLFVDWARTLEDPLFTGHAPGPRGYIDVSGRILAGDLVTITVETSGNALRAAGLTGVLVLGQVEQHARHRTAVPA